MINDIFCKIVKKEIPAHIIYEDKDIMAFLDHEPASPGHTLIIPKKHFDDIETIDTDIAKKIIDIAIKLAKIIRRSFHFDGVTLIQVNGKKLQDVRHFHLHLIGKNKTQSKKLYHLTFKDFKDKEQKLRKIALIIKSELNH